MKWINHEIVTGVLVYAVTEDPLLSVFSMAGAILPDKVEGSPFKKSKKEYWKWRQRHRTWSHWPVIYFALWCLTKYLLAQPEYAAFTDPLRIAEYMMIGSLLHIAEDAVCGKVPLLSPKKKVGIRLFKVGTTGEYIFVICFLVVVYMIYSQGRLV